MKIKYFVSHIKFPSKLKDLSYPVKLISFILFVYSIGWGIVAPFFPIYLKALFKSYSSVGIMTGVIAVAAWIWALLLGPLMDKIEKRKIIDSIFVLYLPFSWILLTITGFFSFILFRIYHAFLATSLWLSGETYLRAHSDGKESEAAGLFDSLSGLAYVFGPVVGGFLMIKFGFSMFYVISIFAFLALLIAFKLPDHGRPVKDGLKYIKLKIVKKEFKDYFSSKAIARLSVFNFLLVFCHSFVGMTLPLFFDNLGASMIAIGIVFGLYSIPILFESYFSTFQNKKKLVLFVLVFGTFIFTLLFIVTNLYTLFALAILLGITFCAIYPALFGKFTKLMPKKELGKFSAVNYSVRQLAAGVGPITAGFIADAYGLNYIFAFGALIFIILLIILPKDF